MELTRRHALTGAAALAATPLLMQSPARATAPVADKQAPSFYRYKVGDIQVTVVSDGKNVFKLEDSFVTNAKKDEVNAALEKAYMPRDMMTIYFAPLVINTGGKLVVIDTGNGALAKTNSKGNNGLFHMSPQGLTDILVALMLGLLGMQRVEMFLRARRLLAEARQA